MIKGNIKKDLTKCNTGVILCYNIVKERMKLKIVLNQIIPDPDQPRKTFKEKTLQELKGSYGKLGLIQPITVRPCNGKYMIVIGERRYRASLLNGQEEIECNIREDIDDKVAREMQFAENSQQENVPPLELGKAFLEHRKKCNLTQKELSSIVGLTESVISSYESLTSAAEVTQAYIISGQLDASTASEINTIKNKEQQAELAKIAVDEGLSRAVIREAKPLIEIQPSRSMQSIVAQARYNITTSHTNHRDILNELKRQQVPDLPPPQGKYKAIIIDPPWPIEKILRDARPNQFDIDYPTMTIDGIMELPIPDLADGDGCHIYLWTTHKHLHNALHILEAWGAEYQCLMTWVKNVGFTPFSWMYSTEHCLFGHIGSLPLLKLGKRLDFQAKVREHSRKPEEFYDLVREVSPKPIIDYFAREKREGIEAWGNETTKFKTEAVV